MPTSDDTRASISVVVPVYNSELILPELVKRLEPVLTGVAREYELVLVNDGSRDQSWKIIQEQSRSHPWVRGINLMRNYGQHNALLCGIRAARFDTLVTMDDDLQHPPEEIPRLLAKFGEGYDVVYGATKSGRQGLLARGGVANHPVGPAAGHAGRNRQRRKSFPGHPRAGLPGIHELSEPVCFD